MKVEEDCLTDGSTLDIIVLDIGGDLGAIIALIFGLIVGSFLNVVILRLDEIETIVSTRSHCPKCKKNLAWYDLIPLISFLLLRGKCRYCSKKISWQYPLVELMTAGLFAVAYLKVFSMNVVLEWQVVIFLLYLLLFSFFVLVVVYDLLHYLIPDWFVWPTIGLAFVLQVINLYVLKTVTPTEVLLGVVIGAGVPFILSVPSKGKWMGYGDIFVGLMLGLLLGYPLVIVGLFAAFFIGAIVGVGLMLGNKKKFNSAVPFAPFLILGTMIAYFWGSEMINWYLSLFAFNFGA